MTMKILERSHETGWVTAIVEGHWVQAKVYDEPSTYGVNDGRVSKIAISKTAKWDNTKEFFHQMCYNYDRGLDYDEAPKGLVDKIIAQLETLPKSFAPEYVTEKEKPVTAPEVKVEEQPKEVFVKKTTTRYKV